eukprot:365765-Chlamydomonas_euryale.AAC.6
MAGRPATDAAAGKGSQASAVHGVDTQYLVLSRPMLPARWKASQMYLPEPKSEFQMGTQRADLGMSV